MGLSLELCHGGDIGEVLWSLQNERGGWNEKIVEGSVEVPVSHIAQFHLLKELCKVSFV